MPQLAHCGLAQVSFVRSVLPDVHPGVTDDEERQQQRQAFEELSTQDLQRQQEYDVAQVLQPLRDRSINRLAPRLAICHHQSMCSRAASQAVARCSIVLCCCCAMSFISVLLLLACHLLSFEYVAVRWCRMVLGKMVCDCEVLVQDEAADEQETHRQ